jgi:peptidoglycan/LPS O-acetylase OafA/YrhL
VRPAQTIPALTGLRAVAATWVVLFHYRDDVLALAPALRPLEPLMAAGYLGVDVFFALSGFVLALTYRDRLAVWDRAGARDFVQNRVARVWPAHVLTLHWDLVAAALAGALGVTAGGHRRTVSAYLQNLTMTHGWFSDRPSFNAPAWSISAEWLVYLAFPLLALGLARLRSARVCALLAATAYGALMTAFALWAAPNGNIPHAGLWRVVVEFTAGALLVRVHERRPAWLGPAALPLLLAVAVLAALVPAAAGGDYWLAPVLGLLVLAVALDDRLSPRALGNRWAVAAGEASYCLYLTHVLVQPLLHAVLPTRLGGGLRGLGVLVLYVGVLALVAAGLHRWVEAPLRARLRAQPRRAHAVAPAG